MKEQKGGFKGKRVDAQSEVEKGEWEALARLRPIFDILYPLSMSFPASNPSLNSSSNSSSSSSSSSSSNSNHGSTFPSSPSTPSTLSACTPSAPILCHIYSNLPYPAATTTSSCYMDSDAIRSSSPPPYDWYNHVREVFPLIGGGVRMHFSSPHKAPHRRIKRYPAFALCVQSQHLVAGLTVLQGQIPLIYDVTVAVIGMTQEGTIVAVF